MNGQYEYRKAIFSMAEAHVQLLEYGVFVTLIFQIKMVGAYDEPEQICEFADGTIGLVQTKWFPTVDKAMDYLNSRQYSDWNPLRTHISMDFQNWSLTKLRDFARLWGAIPEAEQPKVRSRGTYVKRLNAWLSRQLLTRFIEWDGWEVI